jgi:cytochrome c peroxidase
MVQRKTEIIVAGLLALCAACSRSHTQVVERPIGQTIEIKVPLGLPAVPVPSDNPPTAEAIALGRRLFYEKMLSADGTVACASCHNPKLGFSDANVHSLGVGGKTGTRNAPTVINAAYAPLQFWDGRSPSLEDQAGGPIANPVEMNQSHDVCVTKLGGSPEYKAAFEKVFGPGPVTIGKVEKALASFERTVLSGNSPFDRYEYGGEKSAMTPAALRGMELFRDKDRGNCIACHTIDAKFALFTDGKFHNIGAGVNGEGDLTDLGRYKETKADRDKGAFKTPTLRNVALSAPYMHDGSFKTLRDVVDYYAGGGNSNPHLDKDMKSIPLSGAERADLVAFLESLTGEVAADTGPPPAAAIGQVK